jgi:outer membrane lipoprotein carrier protein
MMRQLRQICCVLLCWCGAASTAFADPLNELLALLEPIQGLSASFTQDTFDAQQKVQQHNEGELIAQAPNRFYWKTLDPYPQEVITDGKTLWVYDPDLQQVTEKAFDESYSKTPAMLFAGNSQIIKEQFKVEKMSGESLAFRLLPKSAQRDLFTALEMHFEQKKPVSMTILDAMQQRTVLHFSNVKINPSVEAAQFMFVTPAGVDVLRAQ